MKGVKAEMNIVWVGAISAFMEHMVASIIRELENGKPTVRMDKVNQVLNLFGEELQPVKISDD